MALERRAYPKVMAMSARISTIWWTRADGDGLYIKARFRLSRDLVQKAQRRRVVASCDDH
jgi:hypothetical protein